jgi:uncharacterized protein YigE (DUF2233 family)
MNKIKKGILYTSSCLIMVFIAIFYFFNLSSNCSHLFNQTSNLLVKSGKNWIPIEKALHHPEVTTTVYRADGVRVGWIYIKRSKRSNVQKAWEFFFPVKVMILEFQPGNEFRLIAEKKSGNYYPYNNHKALKKSNASFVVNTSFYSPGFKPLGELMLDGKKITKENKRSGGFFKVIDGKPRVGPRSLFSNLNGKVIHACQAHPAVMINGNVFNYILSEKPPYHSSYKIKTYRNLIGEKDNGNIVFVLSNRGALVSIKEISILASLVQINNASLFDGGVALQYKFNHMNKTYSFSASNNTLRLGKRIEGFIYKKTRLSFSQKSPVFLGVNIVTDKKMTRK